MTIIGNLVDNAIDAVAGQPGTAHRDRRHWTTEDGMRIVVTDNGPGVPAEHLTDVFVDGYSTKPAARTAAPRARPGAGAAAGAPGRRPDRGDARPRAAGSSVQLPTDAPSWPAPAARRCRPIAGPAPIRTLVVDDDFRVARIHAASVERIEGFSCVGQAHTAAEARQLIDASSPDLLILDIYLPDEDGLSLLRSLAGAPARRRTASSSPPPATWRRCGPRWGWARCTTW